MVKVTWKRPRNIFWANRPRILKFFGRQGPDRTPEIAPKYARKYAWICTHALACLDAKFLTRAKDDSPWAPFGNRRHQLPQTFFHPLNHSQLKAIIHECILVKKETLGPQIAEIDFQKYFHFLANDI